MKNKQSKLILFLLLMTLFVSAQEVLPKDTVEVKHYTASSPDLPPSMKEYMELSRKYPNRSTFFPEELGENLTDTPKEELLRRLQTAKDKIELRKVANVLGDCEIAGTLKLTESETAILDTKIRAYILVTGNFGSEDYAEIHSQIIRFWQLAVPELLRNLENTNPHVRAFAFNTLVQLRSENVVRIMINKAKACKDPNLKNMYIGTLGIMKQDEYLGIPNRACMDAKSSQELYDRLIAPALKELSPPEEGTGKN
jgi:hypothetical protein